MQLIRDHLPTWDAGLPTVLLLVDRLTLAKRRWRGIAADGAEFGFDLEHHLHDGDVFFQNENGVYQLQQSAEPVLDLELTLHAATATRVGWLIGNLHFLLEVTEAQIRVADDPALRQLFAREHIPFTSTTAVFHPLSGGHHH